VLRRCKAVSIHILFGNGLISSQRSYFFTVLLIGSGFASDVVRGGIATVADNISALQTF
jgi:hypothetical protein